MTTSRKSSVCILVSGGLDSAVLLGELALRGPVQPVYVSQGLAWEDIELHWLQRFLKAVARPSLQPLRLFFQPMGDVYGRHWSLPSGQAGLPGKAGDKRRKVPGYRSPD